MAHQKSKSLVRGNVQLIPAGLFQEDEAQVDMAILPTSAPAPSMDEHFAARVLRIKILYPCPEDGLLSLSAVTTHTPFQEAETAVSTVPNTGRTWPAS